MTEPLRVANCSGFFGDRLSAAREMVEGGPIDVLTGDWLAELTMVILKKTEARTGGIATSFLRQVEQVLPQCVEKGITIVSNAGGLAPARAAEAVAEIADRLGLALSVASVAGDDIVERVEPMQASGWEFTNLDTGEALGELAADLMTANAYVGAAPIAAALSAGADVVVTGRVTDASLVVGPGIARFGWGPEDIDALAGAVVAGHVIECGAQCCGGNYAFFTDVPGIERIGFPIAELHADGSSVITKHPGTGGRVSIGTVTAQLLYEIGDERYLSPDATVRFDTIELADDGPDRVRVSGIRGEAPPETLKVTANVRGGWRNAMTLVVSGGTVEAKAAVAEKTTWANIPGGRDAFAETAVDLLGDTSGNGVALLRIAVRGNDEALVGRAFSRALVETTLAGYPGMFATSAPSAGQEIARYWPTTVPLDAVTPVVLVDGAPVVVPDMWRQRTTAAASLPTPKPSGSGGAPLSGPRVATVLGDLVGARSGDKGGKANVGVWADEDAVFEWLVAEFTEASFKVALPESSGYAVARTVLANLRALNFVVEGILGWGVASNLRLDSQAKGMGELLRSAVVEVPAGLLEAPQVEARRRRRLGGQSNDLGGPGH